MSGIPLLVEAAGLRALVVGGGAVAARKARALAEGGAHVRVVALSMGGDMLTLARERELRVETRAYRAGDVDDAELVVAATNDRDVNAAVTAEARAAHRLVNVVDAPSQGSFVTMAAHRSGALVIGVSAGGVPAAAARMRDEIAARFDSRYESALELLSAVRSDCLARGDSGAWRALSDAVLDDSFCETVESGRLPERVDACR